MYRFRVQVKYHLRIPNQTKTNKKNEKQVLYY